MRILYIAIMISIVIFFVSQTVAPFPYGLIIGIATSAIIIWRAAKNTILPRYSLLNYRRSDPKTDEELKQNKEAFRIVKKKFLEGEISEKEFEKKKKEFGIED